MEYYPDSIISQRHLYTILMCAKDREVIRSTDVHDYIKNWGTIAQKLDEMVAAGLLEECVNRDGRISMNYRLSKKGDFIARMLNICDKAAEGEFDFENGSVDEMLAKQ